MVYFSNIFTHEVLAPDHDFFSLDRWRVSNEMNNAPNHDVFSLGDLRAGGLDRLHPIFIGNSGLC